MAATDPRPFQGDPGADASFAPAAHAGRARQPARPAAALPCLSPAELRERVEEEISRAGRHESALCCLLLRLENFAQIAEAHGEELAERALLHAGETLLAQLRRFDRVGRPRRDELVLVLPGAASAQGETVARRALSRLRAIKIEANRIRQPLSVSIGIAAWSAPLDATELIEQARSAAGPATQGARG